MGVLEDRIARVEHRVDNVEELGERMARVETRLELLPRIEARLDDVVQQMVEHNKVDRKAGSGSIVLPVAVVVSLIELARALIERLF